MMRGALALALIACPGTALAQAYQCRAPGSIAIPPPPQPDGPRTVMPISGYVLAVSWSPEFCRGGKAPRDPDNYQCNGRIGRFGFVLHGLWPEGSNGRSPQWCALTPRPTMADLRANLCMTPVPWLIEHEWAKHGSCMAKSPAAYFKTAAVLWNALRFPDADRLSRQENLTVGALRTQILTLNPGWRNATIGMTLSNGGWLRELRFCYDRAFRPTACSRRSFGPADTSPLRIWRGL